MDYPVIDPVGTGTNIKLLIKNSGNTIAGVGRMLGIADMSTMYSFGEMHCPASIRRTIPSAISQCN